MEICFTIPGDPYGKPRPRVTDHGTYTPDRCIAYEELAALRYKEAAHLKGYRRFPDDASLSVQITAVFPICHSYSRKRKNAILAGRELPTKKPDADNIAKVVLDGINGIAYRDDTQVVDLHVRKIYATSEYSVGQVFVRIQEVEMDG